METNFLHLVVGCAFLLGSCGAVCFVFVLFVSFGFAVRTIEAYGRRIAELEKKLELKPNSRAAMERRDAYEESLFAVVNAQEEVERARVRLDALTNILSKKASGDK